MAITVFYSWQSDCPNSTNRTFIEDALKKAIKEVSADIEVLKAERDGPIELDKDTQGVSGTPPITDVIFGKISEAAVFVPDLTLVGKTIKGRLIPNPNVLIEYGWALCALKYSRMVPIMNTAFGDATAENLPFNMRHLRNPITYQLQEDADQQEKTRVKAELVKELVKAIRLIFRNNPPETEQRSSEHIAIMPTEDPSTFLKKDESLGFIVVGLRPEQELIVPANEHLFLRVRPKSPTQEIHSSKSVLDLIKKGQIWPFCSQIGGFDQGRNKYGAFAVTHDNKNVLGLTQVFLNREIWGIDSSTIDKKSLMNSKNIEFGYFPCSTLETLFIQTLSSYLPFCRDILKLALPLNFIAGATRVEGYRMWLPNNIRQFGERVHAENIIHEGEITDYNMASTVILRPFFEKIWEECGLERPNRDQL